VVKHKIKKIDLINIISNKTGLSQNLSKKILSDLIEILNYNISNGHLSLKNIGTFKLLSKKERIGRNPKTKKEHLISARKVVKFIPSKYISEKLNKTNE
tara:strand:- start:8485 stop:8781 length:297 start_codon:yes stop_codon:yes gene_type:complete